MLNHNVLLNRAKKSFKARDFKRARDIYAEALTLATLDTFAFHASYIGVLLSDIGLDNEMEAFAFFEIYKLIMEDFSRVEKEEDAATALVKKIDIQQSFIKMLESHDNEITLRHEAKLSKESLEAESINGILYADFKEIVRDAKDFRATLTDIIYSTQIVFNTKGELGDFVHLLLENGCYDLALDYMSYMLQDDGVFYYH